MALIENETNYNETNMYRVQCKEGIKFVKFDNKNGVNVNDEDYWFKTFVNSGKFIIHEVICFNKIHKGWHEEIFHVWYEDKE